MLFDRQLAAVEPRRGVVHCVFAHRDRHLGQIRALAARIVHVALGEHRHPRGGGQQTEGHVVTPVDEIRGNDVARHALRIALPRAAVQRAVADDVLGRPGRNRHGGLVDDPYRGSAAVRDLAVEGELRNADRTRDLHFVAGVEREARQAVDIRRRESRVGDRGFHTLGGELQLGATRVLAEIGLADSDDGGFVVEADGHGSRSLSSLR